MCAVRAAALGAALATVALVSAGTPVRADAHSKGGPDGTAAAGLVLAPMDAANGRFLFASKGCVVCHSVNGVGGRDAPRLDAALMSQPMNPFEFAANMWRGAETMVMMQREELGYAILMSGSDLADIIAFVHDPREQAEFTRADIPEDIQDVMEHFEAENLGVAHD